jgi:hypothetical protein
LYFKKGQGQMLQNFLHPLFTNVCNKQESL